MDTLPLWFWLPASLVAWVGFLILEFRASEMMPGSYSRIDHMDGLPEERAS